MDHSKSDKDKEPEKRIREYYEQDGTRVIETVTLLRIQPKCETQQGNILEVDPNFYHQFVDYTNELRARHQAPPLALYKDLNRYAQEWANHLAKINQCIHRDQVRYGENLFYKYEYSKITLNGREPVQSWYDEIEDYYPYFGQDPPKSIFSKVGHFTNLVWKESKRMGVGFAKGTNTVFVVCNYDPPGNLFTAFKDNVLPALPAGKIPALTKEPAAKIPTPIKEQAKKTPAPVKEPTEKIHVTAKESSGKIPAQPKDNVQPPILTKTGKDLQQQKTLVPTPAQQMAIMKSLKEKAQKPPSMASKSFKENANAVKSVQTATAKPETSTTPKNKTITTAVPLPNKQTEQPQQNKTGRNI